MCHQLDPRFFEELNKMDPQDVCRRALCEHGPATGAYSVRAWGNDYIVKPQEQVIGPRENGAPPVNTETGLSIIFYLLKAVDMPLSGQWISEKELAGGTTFFRGPHAVPVGLIEEKFADDLDAFKRACENMGGTPLDMADASYSFPVLPRVPVVVLFWPADEEFDARARMLFDRTIESHLPIDIIFGISEELCFRLSGKSAAVSWY